MNEIYIKAFFGGWKLATVEQAKKFTKSMYSGMQTVHGHDKKVELINKNHLKGITYEKLQKIEVYEQTTLF